MNKIMKTLCLSLLLSLMVPLHAGNVPSREREVEFKHDSDPDTCLMLNMGQSATVHTRNRAGDTILHMAAAAGDLGLMQEYITRGANVNAEGQQGATPLRLATYTSLAAVEMLLKAGAQHTGDVSLVGGAAAKENNQEIVLYLMSREFPARDMKALQLFIKHDYQLAMRRALQKKGFDIDAQDDDGDTLAMTALIIQPPREGIFGALVNAGARTDIENKQGFRAIHLAAVRGSLYAVRLLLERDKAYATMPLVAKEDGRTSTFYPLNLYAQSEKSVEAIADALVAAGAQLNDESAPLVMAACNGNVRAFKKLRALGAKIDTVDEHGVSPLMGALKSGEREMIDGLMADNTVQQSTADKNKSTLLHYAANGGMTHYIEALQKKYGIDINTVDKDGDTALHVAEMNGKKETAAKLRKLGATETQNKQGKKPVQLAEEYQEGQARVRAAEALQMSAMMMGRRMPAGMPNMDPAMFAQMMAGMNTDDGNDSD